MDRSIARLLIFTGLAIAALGIMMLLAPKLPWLGKLPGDIQLSRGGTRIYIPIATSLLLSLLLTLILNLISRR